MTGDQIYFKRANSREWHGPTIVLGQDGQQVLVKSGSTYILVHPCRLQLISRCDSTASSTLQNDNSNSHNATAATKLDPPYRETTNPPDSSDSEAENISSQGETQANRAEASTNNNTTTHKDVDLKLLKANANVKFKINLDSNWETVKLTSRAGKLTGKYTNWWNTGNIYTGDQKSVDLSNVLGLEITGENNLQPPAEETDLANRLSSLSLNSRHTPCCSTNTPSPTQDKVQTHQTLITKSSEDTLHAKLKELNE